MSADRLQRQLQQHGEHAAHTLAKALGGLSATRVTSTPQNAGKSWTLTFDVLLPDGKSYIEFTAVQTGWGGDAFDPSYEISN